MMKVIMSLFMMVGVFSFAGVNKAHADVRAVVHINPFQWFFSPPPRRVYHEPVVRVKKVYRPYIVKPVVYQPRFKNRWKRKNMYRPIKNRNTSFQRNWKHKKRNIYSRNKRSKRNNF